MAMKEKRNSIRNKLNELTSRIDHIRGHISQNVERGRDKVQPHIDSGKAKIQPHIDNGKAQIEKATEDGIAFAINHKGEVAKYAGRAAKGAVVVAKKSKKVGIAIGTGMALMGLAVACKRSMDKANIAKAKEAQWEPVDEEQDLVEEALPEAAE